MELFLSALCTLRTSDCARSRLRLIALHISSVYSVSTALVERQYSVSLASAGSTQFR